MTPAQVDAALARMAAAFCAGLGLCIIAGIAARVWLGGV